MNLLTVLLALLPIIAVLVLLIWRRSPADIAGTVGWVVAVIIAWLFFQTNLLTVFKASLAGVIGSFPITLMVATSILQVTIMIETGAIARVVALIKTIAPKDQIVQIMIVNVGFGTILAALGATPVSILPPIMLAMGYTSFVAIALPALGYDALCTYALLGVPVAVFADVVNKSLGTTYSVAEVGGYFARFMPVISTCIALGMLWIAGGWKLIRRGIVPAILAGVTAGAIAIGMNAIKIIPLTGVAAGLGVVLVMLVYLKLTGKPLYDRSALSQNDLAAEKRISLWAAISPWIILTVFAVIVNLPSLPFYKLVYTSLAMPIEIVAKKPENVRLFWQAYFWILVSTLLALPFLKPTKAHMTNTLRKWLKRAPRPMLASAVFFAIAYIIVHSGKDIHWVLADPNRNMVAVIANASASAFQKFYPLVAPFLGLLGGFVSGSEASSIVMLTKLHLDTANKIGLVGLLIAAASGIGGGLASVISPAKLQNAAASIDRIGEESQVLRVTFVISLIITAVCALMSLIWAFK